MIYFTSDLHFDHANVIKYCDRPFDSVEQMNERMVELWNDNVDSADIIYVLGDFSLGASAVTKYGPRLNGNKYLVPGNHDRCHPVFHKNKDIRMANAKKLYEDAGFIIMPIESTLSTIPDFFSFKLCHMPYTGDHTEKERYIEYRPKNYGQWLLHGHVHDHWKVKGKQINVGVDVWNFMPVSIEMIKLIIQNGPDEVYV